MKTVVWLLVAAAMLLWTGGAWFVASVGSWLQEATLTSASIDWSSVALGVPIPVWVTWWFDPRWVLAIVDATVGLLQATWTAMPWLSTVAGWIAPLTWVLWAVGAALLVLLGAVSHWGMSRLASVKAKAA